MGGKIDLKWLFCWFVLVIFTVPELITATLPINSVLLALGLLATLMMLGMYYVLRRKLKPTMMLFVEGVLVAYLVLNTLVQGGDVLRAIKIGYRFLAVTMWADIFLQLNYKHTIKILATWSWLLLSINFIVSVLFPEGFHLGEFGNHYSFLGLTNHMVAYWVPGFAFCLAEVFQSKKNPFLAIGALTVLVAVPNYLYSCSTGLILTIVISLGSILAVLFGKKRKPLPVWPVLVLCAVGFILLLTMGAEGGLLNPLLEKLHTLQIRTDLWRKALELIAENPVFGYGIGETDAYLYFNEWRDMSPHNMFLMVMLWGGAVALILFLALILLSARGRWGADKRLGHIMFLCVAGYMVYFMMEVTTSMPLFLILLTAMQHHRPVKRIKSLSNKEERTMKILYFMHVDWDWIKQRPHFMAEELSKNNFVSVWYDKSYKRKKLSKNSVNIVNGASPRAFWRIPKDYKYPILFKLNCWTRKLVVWAEQIFYGVDTIYLTYPTMIHGVPRSFKGKIIYDCMDDHLALASAAAKALVARCEQETLRRADVVLFSSLHLRNTVTGRNENLKIREEIVRNGYTRFAGASQSAPAIKTGNAGLSICYFGTIGTWFDWDAVLRALEDNQGLHAHVIGPKHSEDSPTHPRLTFYGAVERDRLQSMVADMDVLVMPFQICDIVLSVDPVKLYEYIAMGKNIIAPYYAEIDRFGPFVHFYRSPEQFSEIIRRLSMDKTVKYTPEQQTRFLAESTWEKRAQQVEQIMKGC